MRDPSDRSGRFSVPWGLLGMIGLILLAEGLIKCHGLNFDTFIGIDWQLSARSTRVHAPGKEILVLGDSLAKFGIAPRVIEDRLGKKTYNLSVVAAQIPLTYFVLRRVLEDDVRPSTIVFSAAPHLMAFAPRFSISLWPAFLGLRECLELAGTARDADFFGEVVAAKLLPSLRYRQAIRTAVLAALQGRSPLLAANRVDVLIHMRNRNANSGAGMMNHDTKRVVDDAARRPLLYPPTWSCDPINEIYLRKLLTLARLHGIVVHWILPPSRPKVNAKRARLGLELSYTRFIRSIQERFPDLVVIDARYSGYEASVFFDMIHLDYKGASTFSAEVAEVLRTTHHRAGDHRPIWVDLPPYRDRPIDVPLEDFSHSGIALGDLNGGHRRRR